MMMHDKADRDLATARDVCTYITDMDGLLVQRLSSGRVLALLGAVEQA
jgi:hypothetical protein